MDRNTVAIRINRIYGRLLFHLVHLVMVSSGQTLAHFCYITINADVGS